MSVRSALMNWQRGDVPRSNCLASVSRLLRGGDGFWPDLSGSSQVAAA
jgi:hypothetical protein